MSGGQADYFRGTADFNLPLSAIAVARVTLMDQSNSVVDRDQVHYHRYGVAPTLNLQASIRRRASRSSYFKEEENNLPDYGIPFIDGAPAHVERSNYYSLANYDRTRTNTDIGTIRLEQDLSDRLTLSDSLRYANYGFEYLLTGPFLGNDFVEPPPPGTPYSEIAISRDQPSSAGTTSLAVNRTDVTAKFDWAASPTYSRGCGIEQGAVQCKPFSKRIGRYSRDAAAQSCAFLLSAHAACHLFEPEGPGKRCELYALDGIALGANWDVDLGLRWDRFKSSFSEVFSGTGFERTDTFVSPRVAVIYKPDAAQSYYLSYGTSHNPVIEYLIVAPSDESLSPEKNNTLELGGKIKILSNAAQLTGALFDTRVYNARILDPDDPTVQQMPFDQHVQGLEAGINGYVRTSGR